MAGKQQVDLLVVARNATDAAFRGVDQNIKRTERSLTGLKAAVAATFGVAAVTMIGRFIKSTVNGADQLAKLSSKLGVSTEALSQYKFVAEQSGVTFETLTMGWQRMTRRIAEAAQGTGEAQGALKELRLEARELAKLSPEQQFEQIAKQLGRIESPAHRVRLAMKIWDSEGVSLLQITNQGVEAMKKLRAEADRLGLTVSAKTARAAERFNDAWNATGRIMTGVANRMLEHTIPVFEAMTSLLRGDYLNALKWVVDWNITLAQGTLDLTDSFLTLIETMQRALANLPIIGKMYETLANGTAYLREKVADARKALEGYKFNLDGTGDATRRVSNATKDWIDISMHSADAQKKLAEAQRESERALDAMAKKAQQTADSVRTPVEVAKDAQKELEDLRFMFPDIIDDVTFERKTKAIQDDLRAAELASQQTTLAMVNHWSNVGNGIIDFAFRSKKTLADWLSFGIDMLQQFVNYWFEVQKMTSKGGGGGGGGIWGTVLQIGGAVASAYAGSYTGGAASAWNAGAYGQFSSTFAEGGIATKPSIFGEAGPEAAVPLPDGRTIPVTLRGGTGGDSYYIDARGAGAGVETKIREVLSQERPGIIREAVGESMSTSMRAADQGGAYARAMGRRR